MKEFDVNELDFSENFKDATTVESEEELKEALFDTIGRFLDECGGPVTCEANVATDEDGNYQGVQLHINLGMAAYASMFIDFMKSIISDGEEDD